MSDELKPCQMKLRSCPHCGNNDYVTVEGTVSSNNFEVVCDWLLGGCGASSGARRTEAEAIVAWNTRADDAQVIENAENYNLRPGIVCQFIPTSEKHELAANDNLSAETDISVDGHACNDTETVDSRERLEADVRWQMGHFFVWDEKRKELVGYVLEWLDRQAAITERELCARCTPYATTKDYLDTIDSLTAERDLWNERARQAHDYALELIAERDYLKAELETYRKYADQGKCDNCGTVENETSQVPGLDADGTCPNKMGQASIDTREKLEADISAEYYMLADKELEPIFGWLDRQAAITKRETSEAYERQAERQGNLVLMLHNKLTDTQQQVDELTADAKRWADAANAQRLVAIEQADKVQELTAERDELRKQLAEKQRVCDIQRESFRKIEADCKRLANENECFRKHGTPF